MKAIEPAGTTGPGTAVRVRAPFGETVDNTRAALLDQGFGVLTEIDLRAALREKIGQETEDYVVLGACHPALAYRALGVDRSAGTVLPCNVVIRAEGEDVVIEAADPHVLVTASGHPELKPVADEAANRISLVLAAVRRLS